MGTYFGQIKIDNGDITPIGTTLYGVCSTSNQVAAKVAIVPGFDKLITGVTVHILFRLINTTSNPTLAIKSSDSSTATEAKYIMKYGTTNVGTSTNTSWDAGTVISLTYDGTYWQMNNHLDDTITVSGVKGNANSNYKTGNVNLTPADIGALSVNGDTMTVSSVDNGILVTRVNNSTVHSYSLLATPNRVFINKNKASDEDPDDNESTTLEAHKLALNSKVASINKTFKLDIELNSNNNFDIIKYGSGVQSWAGISSSLDETLTKMWSTRGVYGWTYQNSSHYNATSMVTINTAAGQTITTHGGVILFHYFGVMQTSRNTSFIRLCIDDVLVTTPEACITSSTSPMKVDGVYACTLNAGTHNIKLKMAPQDSGTTATLLAYNTFGWSAIET